MASLASLAALDLDAGTLTIEPTRVVDGKVIESDGKAENTRHVLALNLFTLAVLKAHVETLDRERRESGRTTGSMGAVVADFTIQDRGLGVHFSSRADNYH
jgi:hypothetical protein